MASNESIDEAKTSARYGNPDIISESVRQQQGGYGSPVDDIVIALKAMNNDNTKSTKQEDSSEQDQSSKEQPKDEPIEVQERKVEEKINMNTEKIVEEYEKLKSDFENDLKTKREQLEKLKDEIPSTSSGEEEKGQALNLETLVNYLNDNKNILMEKMPEDDRKRVESVLTLSKDVKSMCKEAVDALKVDLMGFYNLGKNTFVSAITEIGKITPLSESKK